MVVMLRAFLLAEKGKQAGDPTVDLGCECNNPDCMMKKIVNKKIFRTT